MKVITPNLNPIYDVMKNNTNNPIHVLESPCVPLPPDCVNFSCKYKSANHAHEDSPLKF
jgi:hypothetical protein